MTEAYHCSVFRATGYVLNFWQHHGSREVSVSSNGTTLRLRVRIARDLPAGEARLASTLAGELHAFVEVAR